MNEIEKYNGRYVYAKKKEKKHKNNKCEWLKFLNI